MSDKQKLGVSLVLALSDLGNCDDCTYMETGAFELFGETEEGLECSAEVDIADMCAEAAERIQDLEKQLAEEKEVSKIWMDKAIGQGKELRAKEREIDRLKRCPKVMWGASNKVSAMFFESEDDARHYSSSFGAAVGIDVYPIDLIPATPKE